MGFRWHLSLGLAICLAMTCVTGCIAAATAPGYGVASDSAPGSAAASAPGAPGGATQTTTVGQTAGKGWYIAGDGIVSSPADPEEVRPISEGDWVEETAGLAEFPALDPPSAPPISPALTSGEPAVVGEALDILPDRPAEKPAPNRLRELTCLRTSTSRSYLNDDGSITAEISTAPVNYRDKAGRWQPIDLTPREVPAERGGGFRVERTTVPVILPAEAGGAITLAVGGGTTVEMTPAGTQPALGVTDGNQIVYGDAWPGVDPVEEVTESGLKETMVLKHPDAPRVFEFAAAVKGADWKVEPRAGSGARLVEARSGAELLTFPAPTLVDAAGAEGPATMVVEPRGFGLIVTLSIDQAWLNDPSRVFPVELDPTATVSSAADDTYVDSAYPTTNYGQGLELKVSPLSKVAFVKWDLSAVPDNVSVISAIAGLSVTAFDGYCRMSRVTSDWNEDSATWNTRPSYITDVYSPYVVDGSWRLWDITDVYCLWRTCEVPNYGAAIYGTSIPGYFHSSENTHNYPKLQVTYTSGADGLGLEDYWQFESRSLGNGWSLAVNTASHNIVLGKTLFSISGRGPNLAEGLTYNSRARGTDRGVGTGWRLATDMTLAEVTIGTASFVDIVTEDGTTLRYVPDGVGGYTTPPGTFRTLAKVEEGVYTLTDKRQTIWRFEGGYLHSIADRNGNALTFERTGGAIQSQTEASGTRSLTYAYGEDGRVATITAPGGRVYSLAYDANGCLASVTDTCGYTVTIGYDAAGAPTFTDALGHTTTVTGGATAFSDVVIRDSRSTPETSCDTIIHTALVGLTLKTRVTDPSGRWVDYEQDPVTWNPTKMVDALGNTTDWLWTDNLKTKETLPGSGYRGYTTWTYDVDGNVTHSRTLSDLPAYTFIEQDLDWDEKDRPVDFTDANGRVISMEYDSAGDLLSAIDQDLKTVNGLEYAENGNPLEFTPQGSAQMRAIPNASLERAELDGTPESWGWSSLGGTFRPELLVDSTVAMYGQCSGEVVSTDLDSYCFYHAAVPVTDYDAYTFAADLRLEDVQASTSGGVRLRIRFTTDTDVIDHYGVWYRGTGTVRAVLTGAVPYTSDITAWAGFEISNATGTLWVDGFQLEVAQDASQGYTMSGFNSVDNSSFNDSTASWSVVWDEGSGSFSRSSSAGQLLAGASGCVARVYQRVPVNDVEEFTASAVVKTTDATAAKIVVDFYDSGDTLLGSADSRTLSGSFEDWLRLAFAADAPPTATYAYLTIYFEGPAGSSMLFDNVEMTPKTTTVLDWDENGNYRTASVDPQDNRDEFAYDEVGGRTAVEDGNGNAVAYTYDLAGRTLTSTDAQGHASYSTYDASGNLVEWRDPRSLDGTDDTYLTRFTYDPLGRTTSVVDPLGRSAATVYDPAGNLLTESAQDGRVTNYGYDAANRLISENYLADGRTVSCTLDPCGNTTGVTDTALGAYALTYDKANRLIGFEAPANLGGEMAITLDPGGNILKLGLPDYYQTFAYGSGGRLTKTFAPDLGANVYYYYNDRGRLFRVKTGSTVYMDRCLEYYRNGWLKSIWDYGNPGGEQFLYEYDAAGNIVRAKEGGGWNEYGYDAENQLVLWRDAAGVEHTYTYDAVGNLTEKDGRTFAYDAANQMTNASFTFDDNGNLTSDGTLDYAYDTKGQLTEARRTADATLVATYAYDYRGLRASKTVYDEEGLNPVTTYFVYTPSGDLFAELDSSGDFVRRYGWGPGGNLAFIQTADGKSYFAHTSLRGDVRSLTEAVTGSPVAATYEFDPWGAVLTATGLDQPIKYASYYHDAETGLYYVKARYYSPELGRFLTKDPAESVPSYIYAGGDPVAHRDESGCIAHRAIQDAADLPEQRYVQVDSWRSVEKWVDRAMVVVALSLPLTGPIGLAVLGALALADLGLGVLEVGNGECENVDDAVWEVVEGPLGYLTCGLCPWINETEATLQYLGKVATGLQ